MATFLNVAERFYSEGSHYEERVVLNAKHQELYHAMYCSLFFETQVLPCVLNKEIKKRNKEMLKRIITISSQRKTGC